MLPALHPQVRPEPVLLMVKPFQRMVKDQIRSNKMRTVMLVLEQLLGSKALARSATRTGQHEGQILPGSTTTPWPDEMPDE